MNGRYFLAATWRDGTWRDESMQEDTGIKWETYRVSAMVSVKVYDSATGLMVGGWEADRERLGQCRNPRLFPDGRLVALQVGMPYEEGIAICALEDLIRSAPQPVMLAQGVADKNNDTATILRYCYGAPAWSPDGKRIAFVQGIADVSGNIVGNLFIANADGSGARQVTNLPPHMYPGRPCFSPDGTRIALDVNTSRDGRPIQSTAGTNANLDLYYWASNIFKESKDLLGGRTVPERPPPPDRPKAVAREGTERGL